MQNVNYGLSVYHIDLMFGLLQLMACKKKELISLATLSSFVFMLLTIFQCNLCRVSLFRGPVNLYVHVHSPFKQLFICKHVTKSKETRFEQLFIAQKLSFFCVDTDLIELRNGPNIRGNSKKRDWENKERNF